MAAAPRPDTVASVLLTGRAAGPQSLACRWLTAAEQARAASFDDPADRRDYQAAHLLVRQVAARLLGQGAHEVTVVQACERCGGSHGRPVVRGHPWVQISLSHTRGAVIAAASAEPVGADIESLHRPRFDLSLLEQELTAAEFGAIGRSADPHAAFLRQWVRKEALAKAGLAAAGRMGQIDLAHLEMSGTHDPAPVRTGLGHAWPRLLLVDRVDKSSGIAFAVVSHRPVLLCAASPVASASMDASSADTAREPGGPPGPAAGSATDEELAHDGRFRAPGRRAMARHRCAWAR